MDKKNHARLIGRIIFADLLEYPLEKYKGFIEAAESLLLFEKRRYTRIKIRRLSPIKISENQRQHQRKSASGVIAEIVKNGNNYSIRYTNEFFNKIYLVETFDSIGHKLRRISSRNKLTHRIIEGIIKRQKKYLSTGNPINLVPFSQVQLVNWINKSSLVHPLPSGERVGVRGVKADISWTSRLVNRLSVITPSGEERTLKSFFLTQKDINKRLIKQLLDIENEAIESGKLKRPLTDNQIRDKLEREHGLSLSRWTVGHCRKDMGIPSFKRRLSGYKYPPLSANFSMLYPLALEEVLRNASPSPGVYELRLKGREIEYPNGKTKVIYIGSTKNIKKRLREHLGKNTKNGHIRDFLKKHGCSFRYIQFSKNWKEEEKKMYKLFVTTYGSAPKCNSVRP